MNNWEAWTKPDGMAAIQTAEGEIVTVKNDGITGYGFALEYLEKMAAHYRNHLRAADLILQRQLGDSYKHIRIIPNIYNANLALVSINCAFGNMDHIPDCDSQGNMHFEFTKCPLRATCPFNGFNPANKGKELVCCNPIYETGLTPRQRQAADMLVNTTLTPKEIAGAMGITEQRLRNIAAEIYQTLSVNSRQELVFLLKDKRIA